MYQTYQTKLASHSQSLDRLQEAAATRKDVEAKCLKLEAWIEFAGHTCDTHLPSDAGVALLQEQVRLFERLKAEEEVNAGIIAEVTLTFREIQAISEGEEWKLGDEFNK